MFKPKCRHRDGKTYDGCYGKNGAVVLMFKCDACGRTLHVIERNGRRYSVKR